MSVAHGSDCGLAVFGCYWRRSVVYFDGDGIASDADFGNARSGWRQPASVGDDTQRHTVVDSWTDSRHSSDTATSGGMARMVERIRDIEPWLVGGRRDGACTGCTRSWRAVATATPLHIHTTCLSSLSDRD